MRGTSREHMPEDQAVSPQAPTAKSPAVPRAENIASAFARTEEAASVMAGAKGEREHQHHIRGYYKYKSSCPSPDALSQTLREWAQ